VVSSRPWPEWRIHPACPRELNAAVDSKRPAAGFESAVQPVERVDQFCIGHMNDLSSKEQSKIFHRSMKKSAEFSVRRLQKGSFSKSSASPF
jgi:hypothetical protein